MKARQKPVLMQVRELTTLDESSGTLKTVRADAIQADQKRHNRLTNVQNEQADDLFVRIGRYFSKNKADWRDGFLYDLHPEAELRVWIHIANVVDYLWVEEPGVLASLKREQLARLVTAVASRVVDIPAHLRYVNDQMVEIVRYVISGHLLVNGSIPPNTENNDVNPELLRRITTDPEVLHGKPSIRGLRYSVDFILELLDSGMTNAEILADYEDLEQADLDAAIYFASLQQPERRLQLQMAGA